MRQVIDNSYDLEGNILVPRVKFLEEQEVIKKFRQKTFYKPLFYDLEGIALDQANFYSGIFSLLGFETKVEEGANLMIDSGNTGNLSFLARRTNEHTDIVKRFEEDRKRKESVDEIEGWFFSTKISRYEEIPRVNISFNYFYFSPSPRGEALRMLLGINKE